MDYFKALHSSRSEFVRYCAETTRRNLREPAWLVCWAILAALIIYNGITRA
jgi:hypothetical protein